MEQGSPEWLAARRGKVTASRLADVVAKGKGGAPSQSRAGYAAELIAERLTGSAAEHYVSAAMAWGTENEPFARAAYQFREGAEVARVGFIDHPGIANCGASPDGLVGVDGLVEFKCPTTPTHIGWLLGSSPVPDGYVVQVQWQLACTGRQWCDFVSFDPRMPESMRLYVRRIDRDHDRILFLESSVRQFLREVDESVNALKAVYEPSEAA